ncbi:MAG: gliding motility-associated C-terminal domain-containing protein [Flavobacteriales bacterium]|nr:gliding motility-associated C-terminal domain-containing protein [Flavobacteriales bacterium]
MRQLILFISLLLSSLSLLATHNRAGEITYSHINGFTYEITITTCTKTSVIADRQWLKIDWGDVAVGAELDSLERESIFTQQGDAQINIYKGTHTYSGPGIYELSVADPNRNEGVINITNSVNQIFCIHSTLVINPQTGHNNSVQLLNFPKDNACLFKVFEHNPGAFDPDGDILTYSIIPPAGEDSELGGCASLPSYSVPASDVSFGIDPVTGTVTWDSPQQVGEYNIAILIEEWREVAGQLIKVGDVVRDMQVTVELCTNNPPEFVQEIDTCVEAYSNVSFTVEATDPDGDNIDLNAFGGPLTEVEHPGNFVDNNDGTGVFSWTPECEEIRATPYQMTFQAVDNSAQIDLVDYMTMNITVVAPAVENPAAEADGNSINLTWETHLCLDIISDVDANNATYKIYRRSGFFGFDPSDCELGVPEYTGYQLIDTVEGLTTTNYTDTQNLFYGGEYCYMIVMCLPDGSISYASEEFCAEIIKDVPVMTNADVDATDLTAGEMYVAWSPPIELDTENFPGPYHYELRHSEGLNGAANVIFTSPMQTEVVNEDTTFVHSDINTVDFGHVYTVEFYSGEDLVQVATEASSIFLELLPGDNSMTLVMNMNVPWINQTYDIYRRDPGATEFLLVGSTEEEIYEDIDLINNQEYCYYVTSNGGYDAPGVIDPIINDSQEACASPVDLTPPCPPELNVEGDCELETATLTWTNPNDDCADDVTQYFVYYSPTEYGELTYLTTIEGDENVSFVFNELAQIGSIAGCYAVTALDSLLPGLDGELRRNESDFSNIFCIDNCPEYELPNVFSPNNDGSNDVFIPFPYKFIDSIDFQVYNRWGDLVFQTLDPAIGWNGTDQESGNICSDGTYFYTIKVNTIRLAGIVTESYSGTITLFDGKNPVEE